MDNALEVTISQQDGEERTLYVSFEHENERNKLYNQVVKLLTKECKTELKSIDEYTKLWVSGKLSNYDYLHVLNLYASRSKMDLS